MLNRKDPVWGAPWLDGAVDEMIIRDSYVASEPQKKQDTERGLLEGKKML